VADAIDLLLNDLANTEALQGKIRDKATSLGVDPALALSVAHQESGFNPAAISPTGVVGLFQVQRDTGRPYGQMTEADRFNADVSMHAGISHLAKLLKETGGNVPQALMRYNGGTDPQYVQHVMQHYPLHAQASQGAGGAQGAGAAPGAGADQGDEIDALIRELGLTKPQAAPQAAPPAAPPAGGQAPAQAPEPYSPMLRNPAVAPPGQAPAVPSVPDDMIPYSGGPRVTIDIAKPSSSEPAPPVPPATPPPSGQAQAPGWLEWAAGYLGGAAQRQAQEGGVALPPGGGMPTPEAQQAGVEQFLKPSEVSAKQLAGMGVQAVTTAAGAAAGAPIAGLTGGLSIPIGAGVGSYYGHRLNQELGLTPGKREGVLPQTFEDYVSLGVPMLPAVNPIAKGLARVTRAGRAVTEADTATLEAMRSYMKDFQAQKPAFEAAVKAADASQKGTFLQKRAAAEEATNAAQRAWHTEGPDAYRAAEAKAKVAQKEYADLMAGRAQDTAAQTAAVAGAEAIPGRMQPTTPSRDLYREFADASKGKPVDLTPATTVAENLQAVLPYASPELQAAVKELQSLGPTATAERVHDLRKIVGDIYANSDKRTKGYAAQIFGGLKDAITTSLPEDAPILARADTIWQQEQGVKALQKVLGPDGSVITMNERGEKVLNVKQLLNQVERSKVMDWLTPQEQTALRADVRQFIGTPDMPKGGPPPTPDAAPLPGTMAMEWAKKGPPPEPTPLKAPGFGGKRLSIESIPPIIAPFISGHPLAAGIALAPLTWDAASYGIAKLLLAPVWRPQVLQWMRTGGPMSKELYGALGGLANEFNAQHQQGPAASGGAPTGTQQDTPWTWTPRGRGNPQGMEGGATR
jgi:Transglycosylase SLT domain